jgi:Ca2+-binding RTX toxin-like protein
MTIQYFTFNTTGTGIQGTVTAGNGIHVSEGVTVGSDNDYAITGSGSNISVDVDGRLYGDLGGLSLAATTDAFVRIGEHGQVAGDVADAKALKLDNFDGTVESHGLIRGDFAVDVLNASNTGFNNFGTIVGTQHAVELEIGSTGTFSFFNFGRIDTATASHGYDSIYNSEGTTQDAVMNSGIINGIIKLGGGMDAYYGSQAKLMDGPLVSLVTAMGDNMDLKLASYVYGGGGADHMFGSRFGDIFIGEGGNDKLSGAAGNDFLDGGIGRDQMTGGQGKDEFVYNSIADSHDNAVDIITDFNRNEHDKLGVDGIDTQPSTTDDDAFTFIGTQHFSGAIGELRYEFHNGRTTVLGNLDHDNQAEFEITLNGSIHLQQSDFVL